MRAELLLKKQQVQFKQEEQKLKKLVHFDTLTKLLNRTQFNIELKKEIVRSRRYDRKMALLYLNIDFFKKVNNKYGYHFADLLLKEVAERLRKLLRIEDSASRLSMDEFAVILTEIDNPHDAGMIAHRMLQKMNEPYQIHGKKIVISVSIGIACYPDAGRNAMELHQHAASAVRSAKGLGRSNYQFFTAGLQKKHVQRLKVAAELHFALENKEFFLMYQPRVDLRSGKMMGMEALLRWQHPVRGVISPSEFISIAEETGLIVPIGEWVLRTACKQFAKWRENYPIRECELAVNVSPRQFQHRKFISMVTHVLQEYKIPPRLLELEITETAVMNFLGKIEDALFQLRHKGIKFSIDDFGTGYSSLARLKELPIQLIKMDRSFVCDIDVRAADNLIIKSTIELAKEMGLTVVAEGVETEAQVQFLLRHECSQAQGYYYSKPLTVEQMTKWISNPAVPYERVVKSKKSRK